MPELPAGDTPLILGQGSLLEDEFAEEGIGAALPSALVRPAPHTDERPPRIARIWFRNFKSFSDFEVAFGSFNVLAGANNAGKTTILQGVDLLFVLLKLHQSGERLGRGGRLLPLPLLPVAAIRDLFFGQRSRAGNEYVDAVVGAEFRDGTSVEFGPGPLLERQLARTQPNRYGRS